MRLMLFPYRFRSSLCHSVWYTHSRDWVHKQSSVIVAVSSIPSLPTNLFPFPTGACGCHPIILRFFWQLISFILDVWSEKVGALRVCVLPLLNFQMSIFLIQTRQLKSTFGHVDVIFKSLSVGKYARSIGSGGTSLHNSCIT